MVGYKDETSPWGSVKEALEALEAGQKTTIKSETKPIFAEYTLEDGDTGADMLRHDFTVKMADLGDGHVYVVKDSVHHPEQDDIKISVDNQTLAHLLEPKTPWIIGGKVITDEKHDWGTYHIEKGILITPYVTGDVMFRQLQGRIDLVRQAIDDFNRPMDVFDNRVFSFSTGPDKKNAPGG